MTPGISVDGAGSSGAGGGAELAAAAAPPPIENGARGFLHFATSAAYPAFCQDCWLWPQSTQEEVPCVEAEPAAQPISTARAVVDFIVVLLIVVVREAPAHSISIRARRSALSAKWSLDRAVACRCRHRVAQSGQPRSVTRDSWHSAKS